MPSLKDGRPVVSIAFLEGEQSKLFNSPWTKRAYSKRRVLFCIPRNGLAMLHPLRTIVALLTGVAALANTAGLASAQSAGNAPIQLETKIPLGDVRGQIDHMAIDLTRQRLFVAELGNDSVGIVDLANRKVINRVPGLKEPQGVGYEPSTDTLYVANAGNGSVNLFDGDNYKSAGKLEFSSDADKYSR
jgi:YVTN family beta-propeller protein